MAGLVLVFLACGVVGQATCDLECFLGNLTFRLGAASFPGGSIRSFNCSSLTLGGLSSTLAPPTGVGVAVQQLSLVCLLDVHIDVVGTFVAVVTSEKSTLSAELQFVLDKGTGLASKTELLNCVPQIQFEVDVAHHPILNIIVDIVKTIFGGRLGKLVRGEVTSLVDTNLTNVIVAVNDALKPFLAADGGPPPPSPDYGPGALNFTGNALFGMVDFLLDDLIGADGPFGVNRIISALSNGTGAFFIDFGANGTEVTTQSVGGLGNVTIGLYSISLSGLTTFGVMQVLVPRDSFSLDSHLALGDFALNMSFYVSTVVEGGMLQDQVVLTETGIFRFSASNMSVGLSVSAAVDAANAASLNLNQLISVGCLIGLLGAGNVTQARLGFALRELLVVAVSNEGQLEGSLDALIDNVLLLFLSAYDKVIPAFLNAIVLSPAIAAVNAAIVADVFDTPRPCALRSLSSSSSAYPLNPVGALAVLGGAIAAWIGVTAIVFALHWTRYSKEAQERDDGDDDDDDEELGLEGRRDVQSLYEASISPSPPPPLIADKGEEAVRLLSMPGDYSLNTSAERVRPSESASAPPPPIGLDPRLSWVVKILVPFLIVSDIGLFVVSNMSVGASVFAYIHLGNHTVTTSSLFSFTLANSVHDMWVAGVYPLSLIIAVFSGCWPYVKLLAMLVVWLAPVAGRLREKVLMVLDMLGKWSLIDAFVLVFMMVAFRFKLVIPGSALAQTKTGQANIDLLVEADLGFYTFLLATMVSLIITHVILGAHRWLDAKSEPSPPPRDAGDDGKARAVFQAHFQSGIGEKHIRATRRGAVCVAVMLVVSLGCVIGGALAHSFEFHFRGAAGAVFPYAGVASDRSFSLVSLAMALPEAAFSPNGFGVRWVQATFLVFALVVPLCYLTVLLALWLVPMRKHVQMRVFEGAEILRAWSAMEVFVLAVIAALTELEQFAQFLVGDRCDFINPVLSKYFSSLLNGSTTCFDVTTTLTWGCWIMFAACVLYLVAGQIVMSLCHAIVFPDKDAPEERLSRKVRLLIFLRMARMQ
jgi:hypothetical protein